MSLSRTRLVLGVALAVGAAATGACRAAAPGETVTPAVASSPVPAAQVAPVDPARPRPGPADPQLGVAYPFDLYTHCGIEYARFGGRWWQASPARPEPRAGAGADGVTTYSGYTAGTMTLVGTGVARFVIDLRHAGADEPTVTFFPTGEQPPPCE